LKRLNQDDESLSNEAVIRRVLGMINIYVLIMGLIPAFPTLLEPSAVISWSVASSKPPSPVPTPPLETPFQLYIFTIGFDLVKPLSSYII
jgi:hypothetical protein